MTNAEINQKKPIYRAFSDYLKERYGEKVYKLPIALPVTCPNRDGSITTSNLTSPNRDGFCGNGNNGCTFCGEIGAGYENLPRTMTITEQITANKAHIVPKYKAKKFIPYFQNFSNTYVELAKLISWVEEAASVADVVAIYIATRPDCVNDEYLAALKQSADKHNIDICVELGLQSTNVHTLKNINRGHTLAELIDAVQRIRHYGLQSCVHLILNLPWDDELDVIEDAKILSALKVDQVKLHALYIVKGTQMAKDYEAGNLTMISREEYEDRVIKFLEYLAPDIVLQRIIGRAPEANTLFSNWHTGWWKIRDHIVNVMAQEGRYQGRLCDYLNGKALKKFA